MPNSLSVYCRYYQMSGGVTCLEKLRCTFRVYYLMRFRKRLLLSICLNFQLLSLGKGVNIVVCVCVYICIFMCIV